MKLKLKGLLLATVLTSSHAWSANSGVITRMGFSSSQSQWGASHSDVVQIEIEGGFEKGDCHNNFAAVRKDETHLVSALLAAFISGKSIAVQVSGTDKYYSNRCVITDVFINP